MLVKTNYVSIIKGKKHFVKGKRGVSSSRFVECMVCDYAEGELKIMEPQKCEEWKWFGWDELPRPLFLSFENLLKKKFTPFAS
jgi:hypothetical protein